MCKFTANTECRYIYGITESLHAFNSRSTLRNSFIIDTFGESILYDSRASGRKNFYNPRAGKLNFFNLYVLLYDAHIRTSVKSDVKESFFISALKKI